MKKYLIAGVIALSLLLAGCSEEPEQTQPETTQTVPDTTTQAPTEEPTVETTVETTVAVTEPELQPLVLEQPAKGDRKSVV